MASRSSIVAGIATGLREGKADEVEVTDREIKKAAVALARSFEKTNGHSLTTLYAMARAAYERDAYGKRHGGSNNRHVRSEEDFGFYLSMRAQGHGVGWDDDVMGVPNDFIKHPHIEVY